MTGVILTKLDGTAKGGIVFAIAQELGVPVRFVGTGERMTDIAFDPKILSIRCLRKQHKSIVRTKPLRHPHTVRRVERAH